MSDLGERLERLGLAQYLEVFTSEGFDSWETVLDITESDLNALNVKLGHRRKLQRAIAEYRGQSTDRPLLISLSKAVSVDHAYRSDDSATEKSVRQADTTATGPATTNTKRKYRRHPRPDENAPERPPSAYVIFSNQVREQLKGQDLSFTEIAKVVGERWQVLDPDVREACERQANAAKELYYKQLAVYKKTPQYESYQKYLEEFKAKHHNTLQKDGKRSKVETEAGIAAHNTDTGRSMDRRTSNTQPMPDLMSHYRPEASEASPPIPPGRLPSAPLYPSNSTSPAHYPMSSLDSPRTENHQYSPRTMSPRTATLHREGSSYDYQPSSLGRDARGDTNMAYAPAMYAQSQAIPSTAPPSAFPSRYQTASIDLPSRRPFRESTRLPPLTHEDTTLSSESGGTHSNNSFSGPSFVSVVDPQKSLRTLPHPVPNIGPSKSPLDRHPSSGSQPYPRSLEALVRAGEMARADDEAAEKPPDP